MTLSASALEDLVTNRKRVSRGLLAMVLVLLAVVPAGYYLGLKQAGEMIELGQQAESLKADNLSLRHELADLRLARKVDADTGEQLRQTIKEMRDRSAEINEELSFYRALMSPSGNPKGVRIEKLGLEKSSDGNRIEYRLMLTQLADRRDWVQGTVNIDVIGEANGVEQVLSLTDFGFEQEYPLNFRFRYFQNFTGILTLPEAFKPGQVLITVVSLGKKGKKLQKKFGWDDLAK